MKKLEKMKKDKDIKAMYKKENYVITIRRMEE